MLGQSVAAARWYATRIKCALVEHEHALQNGTTEKVYQGRENVSMKLFPIAPRTMITIAASCFLAGLLLGAWVTHLVSTKRAEVLSAAEQVDLQDKFSAKIVGTVDGDTVQALTPGHLIYAVRLAGMNAPESAQPFGKESTQHLSKLIFGKTVNLECKNERDDYGRLVCKVLLQPSGEDVCLDQLKAGLAWHYKQYQDEQSLTDRETYAAAEL